MNDQHIAIIHGREMGARVSSRILEEEIQKVVSSGFQQLNVKAFGQHGIGGRLWSEDKRPIQVTVEGPTGQRLGSMGFPGTRIEVMGPASDDVGWLNAGGGRNLVKAARCTVKKPSTSAELGLVTT